MLPTARRREPGRFTLPARPPLLLGIALSRGEENFSDDEVELLALARPHLIQAYRNAELASARSAALRALEAGLETSGHHAVVLDPYGRVEFATETARELLGNPGPGRDALPAEVRAWMRERRGQAAASEPLILEAGGRSLLIRLLPQQARDRRDVLLVEPGPGELSVEALRGLGLTTREAETLRWIALGASAEVAAQRLGMARRTADKHLQNVYAKLGVASAAQATATAWAAVG